MYFGPKSILSGIEIADAVERQKQYKLLQNELARSAKLLSAMKMLRASILARQPRIHIDGFDDTPSDIGGKCNPNSYNLTLAPELLVYDVPIMKPEHRHAVDTDWEPYVLNMKKSNPTKKMMIPEEGYILKPSRLYLGMTNEYTESYNVVPRLDGRSSIGRLGICIHITAAFGDNGYRGTFTMEITVVHPVRIYANTQLCQISYSPISSRGRLYSGRYQDSKKVVASRFHFNTRTDN